MYPSRAGGWVRRGLVFVKGVGRQTFDESRPIRPSNPCQTFDILNVFYLFTSCVLDVNVIRH